MTDTQAVPIVLVIAGLDPSGGAGLQADIQTLSDLGCHALPVASAITVQDTSDVKAVEPVASSLLLQQAQTVLDDCAVVAIKIGLLASADNVLAVAELLRRYPDVPVVVDPVLASGSGTSLGNAQLVGALREQLLPLTTVLTPNTLEARTLAMQSGDEVSDNSPGAWAKILLQTGCDHVLITGTHAPHDDVVNRCYHGDKTQHQTWPRLEGDYHGSGCTLASAIAAYIAKGQDIAGSINQAQAYTWNSLERAYPIGRGQHIPNRLVDPASSA
ncbi:MAG TPA: bifunctional hydroxymethylpyrimidine kinase/phosphomethylpyrimidine kinase [Chromatiaceae bacterium]|jgi:hydroxymethylpyrimidine/phosphomethylpyrimidine kinase|nr:bifunctional hydroxymethylpyrimidine kinase/phosphomethylpyrimidine kinase [Chromatiaceae bacterium]HIA08963.1 bifunctional hydroxymethylpyrimidine kinase/phosphomethylpyrimidine kinase [Chromatiaceae bacterium]HIN83182.1 bifunctional hydroxymethylpyrimidine kinase/phosphomethylpyrimidine kinase [Chromatiales bacterium]HIO14766.1 bifunctional hydroxymethylpyrimidine kinase/phosphomethylpyrimidine kinase [Chromatiales bacterium]HIO53603.1 bifunctional hydroxymethylpyrimidine kinase/phosphomet